MILLAAIPPLWRRVMDHRVVQHYEGSIERANLTPSLRRRLLQRAATDHQALRAQTSSLSPRSGLGQGQR
jgi:hypothetical protein